jgi:hypothetical protein
MSRKDYVALAAALKASGASLGTVSASLTCSRPTTRFDRARFVTASGHESETAAGEQLLERARFAPCAVFGGPLGTLWRVLDRESGRYVSTMPQRFVARESAELAADDLNGR